VSYHTENGGRVTSVHAHGDKSYNEFPSRNYKPKDTTAKPKDTTPMPKGPGKK
jgi:hypothetical protein